MNFKKIKHDVIHEQRRVPLKTKSVSFCESICSRLQNNDAVIYDLVSVPDTNIEPDGDLNVGKIEEVETSPAETCISDKYIDVKSCLDLSHSNHDSEPSLSEDICNEIEARTRGQSDNTLWFDTRKGRITASIFHDVLVRKDSTPPDNLVKRILGNNNENVTTNAIEWGRKHESIARKRYKTYMRLHHKQKLLIRESGLHLCNSCIYLGASPDGIVQSDSSGYIIEIKCPYKWRNSSIIDACRSKDFCCSLDENDQIKLKTHHRYYTQIQGQLGICQYKMCHLILYTLKDLKVIEIPFDEIFWLSLLEKLKSFYKNSVIPCLKSN